jgi:hypothetical protein
MPSNDAVLEKLDSLQTTVDTLTRGLILMTETLATHSEMLGRILEACAVEPEESTLTEILEEIAAAIQQQTAALADIGKSLDNIGPRIEIAVVRGVSQATCRTDTNGVLQE